MFLYITFLCLLFPKVANAYLDPGTGSYIVQILIAVFATSGFLIKTYWRKIKSYFSKDNK